MRKIPRVFLPDGQELGLAGREIDPQCLWVLHYGRATRKFDGTCCLVRDGKLYARRQIKIKRLSAPTAEAIYRAAPPDFEPFFVGHQRVYGWIPVDKDPNCRKHRLLLETYPDLSYYEDGTYELCGPGVNGNNDKLEELMLVKHGSVDVDFDAQQYATEVGLFTALRSFLSDAAIEGIVFHGPSGLYAKISRQHFGLEWPVK